MEKEFILAPQDLKLCREENKDLTVVHKLWFHVLLAPGVNTLHYITLQSFTV